MVIPVYSLLGVLDTRVLYLGFKLLLFDFDIGLSFNPLFLLALGLSDLLFFCLIKGNIKMNLIGQI